jgi:hypothetical protein
MTTWRLPMSVTRLLLITIPLSGWTHRAETPTDGVWTVRIENRAVVPGTVHHPSPPGRYYQPMMHPNGTVMTFDGQRESVDADPLGQKECRHHSN